MLKKLMELLLYCVCIFFYLSNANKIGDECILNDGKQKGVCTYISKCSPELFGLKDSLIYTKCNAESFLIICCPETYSDIADSTMSTRVEKQRISEKKCEEYSSEVYVKSVFLPLSIGAPGIITKKKKCNHQVQPLIVGGEIAGVHEFPHMALIGYPSSSNNTVSWDCAGSLISNNFVLTAAHCLTKANPYVVRLGELDYRSETDGANPKDYKISSYVRHPKYDDVSAYNDIGLILLAGKVELTPEIRPACLPSAEVGQRIIATGWGNTMFAGSGSSHLLKVVLEKFTTKECNAAFQEDSLGLSYGIQNSQFCAGHKTESKDTCNGDSGGPLQDYHKHLFCMYVLYGITSVGQGCGTIGVPGLYTQIYSFIDWIESIVW